MTTPTPEKRFGLADKADSQVLISLGTLYVQPMDIQWVGTPVALVAREVHGKPGLFRNANEFPATIERDFPLSE